MLSVNQVEELKLSLTCVCIHVIHCGGKNLHTVFAVSISWLLLYMLTLFSNRLGYSIVLLLYNLDFGQVRSGVPPATGNHESGTTCCMGRAVGD